jgi:hypothetical protein
MAVRTPWERTQKATTQKGGNMNSEYNKIARKLYGCDYNSSRMTELQKALVRRIHARTKDKK